MSVTPKAVQAALPTEGSSTSPVFDIRYTGPGRKRARKRPPGRPTAEQANELRDNVLHAALRAFMEKGYEAASIEGIARVAKVAKITLYRQFGNKEKLFFEVTRHAQERVRRNLQAAVSTEGPPEQVLREMILRLHEGLTHPDYLAVLRLVIAEGERFPEIAANMIHDSDYIAEPVIRYLQALRSKGQAVIESSRDGAIQLFALAGGGARYLMVRPSHDPAARAHWADSLTALFVRAWQLKAAPTKKSRGEGAAKPKASRKT